jgi:hypothetical protein
MISHLKMYPIWSRSQHDELDEIGTKYEKYKRKMLKNEKLGIKLKKKTISN